MVDGAGQVGLSPDIAQESIVRSQESEYTSLSEAFAQCDY